MDIRRITLIEPKAPSDNVYSMVKMPRLGLPLLGTRLKELGYEVNIIYGSSTDIKVSDIIQADLIGISTTTSTCKDAYNIARFAKSKAIPVIIGGVHATFMPEEALEHCDYVCRGEADFAFPELIDCLTRDVLPVDVPGVSLYLGDRIVHNPLPEWVKVEDSPIPDLSLFSNLGKLSVYPVMTSRGCPYDCTFCSVTAMFGHKYRYRSKDQVISELSQYKGKKVFFCDDHFTANPRRTKELLRDMIDGDILPSWWGAQLRTEAARDHELLELMHEANCGMVYVGLESVNPATLELYNKHQDIADIELCIKNFHKYGIMVHGMFVLGSDNDTVQTVRDTVDFALASKIDTVQFLILVPLPGTPFFKQMEQEDRLITRDWSFYDGHHVVFQPLKMSAFELQAEALKAFKKFYSPVNLTQNLLVSGRKSAELRAAGYYLIRKWAKERAWYFDFLDSKSIKPARINLSKTIESYKLRQFRYLSREKLIDMMISEENGTFMVELKGCLNNFALGETIKTVQKQLALNNRELTINIEQLSFSSEKVLNNFIDELNRLAVKAKSVKLKTPLDCNILYNLLEKNNCCLPGFEL